ncbi:D-alanyl-D-alanine carboxypeptidase family protein [Arenibacterium halophilum]|uniref:serine-type D-Ala-D-Ala carboxypeptidase n=1 Tax=Arenibacterium halophilum TaxID=2583821 RepID=A0ABY2XDM8_9RHOB|nr:D-alanyl-D-alanine carboxypeptidase family protein [Arenibacterium halophilum]MAY89547.1 D-alanyl-D-alanine carboxypeptidase [Pseudooceanicola sp.]TMV15113.1 D-alanyl-D-alanine carboxypeptidase [Arenibacterium halophilum]
MKPFRRAVAATFACVLTALPAWAFDTSARAAYVLDVTTDTVLMQKDAQAPLPPASMSKLMTLYVAFEAIRDGRLTLDERLSVSQHAMSYKGSTMFLNTQDKVRVEDLLRGIIVLSGNDACAVIAEALSPDGTEAGFARYMTQRAQQMGMKNSTFMNSNGWPQAGHRMSVEDLAILAHHLIVDFPEFYPLFAETEFAFDGRAPSNVRNRNPLLTQGIGADGLKTGHTEEAGYGLVGSAKQGDRRVVFVISGLDTERQRAEEAAAIVNWSFRQFAEKTVAKAGDPIAEARVWMGSEQTVNMVAPEEYRVLLPALSGSDGLTGEVVYQGPVPAPIQQGQQLGELVITREDLPEVRLPLVADRAVATGGFIIKVRTAAELLLTRFSNGPVEPAADAS